MDRLFDFFMQQMKRFTHYILLFLLTNPAMAEMLFVSSIPLKCADTKKTLNNIAVPDNFQLNPYQALLLASDVNNNITIKKCASKLEQVIYRDNEHYYFFNSIEYGKPGILPKHIVIINAETAVVIK